MSTPTPTPTRSRPLRHWPAAALLSLAGIAAVLAVAGASPATAPVVPPTTGPSPSQTGPSPSQTGPATGQVTPQPAFAAPVTGPSTDPIGALQSRIDAAFDLESHAYETRKESDYRAAADALESCAADDPDNLQIQQAVGFLWLEKLKDPARAYPHLEKAYAIAPEQTDWALVLAKAAGQLGKTDRQLEVLHELQTRDPDNADVRRALAGAVAATTQTATTQSSTTDVASTVPTPAAAADSRPPGLIAAQKLETRAYATNNKVDYQAAADALENFARTDPDNLKVQQSVGYLCLEKLDDPARAYPHLEKAYALSPGQSDWAMVLAKAAGELGKTDRQLQVLQESLKRDPQNPEVRGALAAVSAAAPAATQPAPTQPAPTQPAPTQSVPTQSGTTQSSFPQHAATESTTAPATDRRSADLAAALALESRAYTSNAKADYQAAADALDKCSLSDPDNLQLQQSLGYLCLEKIGDPARAYPHLEKAHSLAPGQSDWAMVLAKAAGEVGKTDRQLQVLREVLNRDPANADVKKAIADAVASTQPTATQQAVTGPSTGPVTGPAADAVSDQLDAAFALETQAYTTNSKADYQAAADALEKCSKADPDDAKVEQSVGFLWLDKLKDPVRAYPHLEKAYKLTPGDAGWGSLLAKAAGETGRTVRQLEVLADVARLNPDNANSLVEYGQALDKAGRHDEAEKQFQAAEKIAPDDENVLVTYGRFLHSRGAELDAEKRADKVLAANPKSAPALALEGDIRRNDWDLDQARAFYQQALAADPENEPAKLGVTEIHKSTAPTLESSYYYFKGTDHFMQQGLYDTLSFSTSSHIYESFTYNMGYFRDDATRYPSVIRYQEGVGIEDRIDGDVSIRGGLGAFQMPRKEAFGYDIGVTWKPTNKLWIDGTYHTEEPVNDSMYTVANGLSQDILGFTGGYQFDDELALKFAASRSVYSDDATREYIHIEPAYTIWQQEQLRLGFEYETVRYSKKIPGAGGLNWYQTYGPVLELEPAVTDWLSVHFRAELPYVEEASEFGTNLNFGLILKPGRHVEAKLGVFYVHVPESISSYSGSGFDASISFRF